MAGATIKLNIALGSHLKDSTFRPMDLFLALALSLRRSLRSIARVRGMLGAPPPHGSTVARGG